MTYQSWKCGRQYWEFSKPLFVSQFSAGTGTDHSGRIFSDSEDICNYPNDRLGVIIISCLRSYNPHQYRLTPMGISTKMAVFIEDCSICQCTACMNLAMCMEYYVKCNFKIYLNLNDFNPPSCEMLMKNGRGYKNNQKHVIYLFIFYTSCHWPIFHTNLSGQQSFHW